MVHVAVRVFFRVLGGLAFLLLLALAVLAWRLSQGPLPLTLLTPLVREALAPEAAVSHAMGGVPIRLEVGETVLAWENFSHPPDLRIEGLRFLAADGGELAAFPEVAIRVSPRALAHGEVRLLSSSILRPRLWLRRDRDGALHVGTHAGQGPRLTDAESASASAASPDSPAADVVAGAMIDALSGRVPASAGPAARAVADLTHVRIAEAEVVVEDQRLGLTWRIPAATLDLSRAADGAVKVKAVLSVASAPRGGKSQPIHSGLVLSGLYRPDTRDLDTSLTFTDLRPAAFAPLGEALQPLSALDLPLSGTVVATVALPAGQPPRLKALGTDLKAGAGTIRLPVAPFTAYPLKGLVLKASAGEDLSAITLHRLRLDLDKPAAGAVIEVQGGVRRASTSGTAMAGTVDAKLTDLPVDALASLWPEGVGSGARDWVVGNLSKGMVSEGQWTFTLKGPSLDGIDLSDLSGKAKVHGAVVDYLHPLPVASDASAEASFALDRVDLRLGGGRVMGLKVAPGGSIAFLGLDKDDQHAEIALTIGGPMADALRLIDHKPLGFLGKLGFRPDQGSGEQTTRLKMHFPLLADLKLDDLTVEAVAEVAQGSLRGAVFGQDLLDTQATVTATTTAMEVAGKGSLSGVPLTFTWREKFDGKPYRSQYVASAVVEDDKRGVFGLASPPFIPPWVSGPAKVDLTMTTPPKGPSEVQVQADLTPTAMALEVFGWRKPPGVPAQAQAVVLLNGGTLQAVPSFTVTAVKPPQDGRSLKVSGRVSFTPAGALEGITLSDTVLGETRLSGTLKPRPERVWAVDVSGPSFDAQPFLRAKRESARTPEQRARAREEEKTEIGLDVTGSFDTVRVTEQGTVKDVRLSFLRQEGKWRRFALESRLENGVPLTASLAPASPGTGLRTLAAATDDAGTLLRTLDMIGTLRGGVLSLTGKVAPDGVTRGTLTITDYRLVEAPLLARILSVAALTGILDALSGEGIGFDQLVAPYVWDDGLITLSEFRTHGSALGLTAAGTLDVNADQIAVGGTIVPAYAVNSLVGKIPLVGGLLTGFSEGGGLFAATYQMEGSLDEPDTTVNPLSTLAPGFLRRLFGAGEPPEPGRAKPPVVPPASGGE